MKLINGDCMHELKTMDDDIFDLIITDPPYTQTTKTNKSTAFAKWKHNPADLSVMEYYHDSLFSELTRVAKPDGNIYVFCDDQSYPIMWKSILPHVRGARCLIWKKYLMQGHTWRHSYEMILWGTMDKSKPVYGSDPDILEFRVVTPKNKIHPSEKPVDLLKRLITKHAANSILDPFAGSGSTLEAARQVGLTNIVGIELNKTYYQSAAKRLGL